MIFRVFTLTSPLQESEITTLNEVKTRISTAQARGEKKIKVSGLRYETRQALIALGFKIILISNATPGFWQVSWVSNPVRVLTLTRVLDWFRGGK